MCAFPLFSARSDLNCAQVGLLLDSVSPTPQQTRIVLTVDLTETVFNALPPETALVVAYHPILFRPLKALTQADPLQRTLLRCAARNIAVYSPHTSLDAAEGGIDFWLASAFERQMKRLTRIRDASNPPEGHEGAGEGMRIELREPIDLDEAVSLIKSHLNMKTGERSTVLFHRSMFEHAHSHACSVSRQGDDFIHRAVCWFRCVSLLSRPSASGLSAHRRLCAQWRRCGPLLDRRDVASRDPRRHRIRSPRPPMSVSLRFLRETEAFIHAQAITPIPKEATSEPPCNLGYSNSSTSSIQMPARQNGT